jgi:parallel beta-helix repeat protein
MSKMKFPTITIFIIILASILFCGCKDTTDLREGIDPPGKAANPLPPDTATDVAPTAVLRWQPGENAYMFHIYVGTDRTAVQNANGGSPEYRGMVGNPFFDPPGDLSLDTTYYWRVDCANAAAAVKGDTWSFATVVPPPVPVAGFTAAPTTGQAPLAVDFTDTSTGLITSWSWDLNGDGTPDSSVRNPSCTYTQAGTFTVSLTVTGPGGADTEIKTDYIIVTEPPPVADFIGSPTSGPAPLTVQFTDQSTGTVTQWFWDFNNDGLADSALQNPSQTYLTDGTYSVKLTVVGPSGTDSKTRIDYITVGSAPPPAPSAEFSAIPTSGTAPLVVSFTDESTGSITSWQWDFDNDTVVDSTVQNPTHEYSSAGTYTVSLTVTGPGGNNTETKANYITVTEAPVPPAADFVGSPTEGTSPLTVNFTDLSTGDITSWSWNFGDGGTSTQPNPTHKYTTAGIFTVSLTVDGPAGSDGEVKLNYITVYDAAMPEANFAGDPTTGVAPLAVSFTDLSSGQITSWAWDFDGFGVDSTAQNPTWLFATPGTYDVKLTVSGPGGTDSNIKYSYITVDWPAPVANFTATPTAGLVPLAVSFTDASSGNITAWEWDFNNDTVVDSYSQNATHTYDTEGIYSAALTVIGPGGEDTKTRVDYITVTALPKVTGISPAPDEVLSSEPTEILVTFSKEIDASTVNATNFILLASGGDGTFDDGNETPVTLNSVTRIATNIVKMDLFGVSLPDDAYEVSVLGESGFKALDFDIEDDHVYLGKSDVAPPWSAEFWVRREDCPNAAARLMDSANYSLRLEQFNFTNKVGFSWYGAGDYVFNYEAPIDTWVHLAFVGTGSGTSLYVNGILQDTNPNSISLPMESIGASAETIKGTVDEVRLWSIARTGPQIQADMNRILTGSEAGLVGYYRFNEGSGQIVNDSSPLGNHGTRGADANPNTDDPQWVDSTAPIADGVKCVDGYVLDGEFSGSFPSGNNIEGGDFQSLFYIGDMPVANFTATPTDGTEPLLVTFTDQSTGTINSWEWDFNNNGTVDSTVQHPTHIYNAPGMFTVKLTVSGPIGTTSETKGRYIEVESSLTNVIYVDDMDGNDTFDGLSWDTAVKTIQTGLNKASDTWTVLVADGTYTGTSNRDLDFTGKDIILKSTSGALNCIIDCEISGRAFYFHSGETNNSIVEGFTIRNGKITGDNGAGMLITNSSSPTISNCIITNCQAVRSSGWTGLGGAVYCESSSPILSGCTVTSNNATYCAGGLFVYNASNPTIIGCKITDNSADGDSGGIYCHTNSAGQITNCLLSGNSCAAGGGGELTATMRVQLSQIAQSRITPQGGEERFNLPATAVLLSTTVFFQETAQPSTAMRSTLITPVRALH